MSIEFRQDGKRVRKPAGKDAWKSRTSSGRRKLNSPLSMRAFLASLRQMTRRVSLTAAIAEY
jgi:hypothetical protein